MRLIFSAAAPWAEELSVYGMVAAIYLGCSLAIKERSQIRLTLVLERMPPKLRLVAVCFGDLCWMGFIVLLLTQSVVWIKLLFDTIYISPALQIDQKWPQMIVPFSLFLMIPRMIQVYYRWFRDKDRQVPL